MAKKVAAEQASQVKTDANYTASELREFLDDISAKIVAASPSYLHPVIALNHLLTQPNAQALFADEELKQQARDIWIKAKSTGLQLNDPPLLFGHPEIKAAEKHLEDSDGTEEVVIDMTRFEQLRDKSEDESKKKGRRSPSPALIEREQDSGDESEESELV